MTFRPVTVVTVADGGADEGETPVWRNAPSSVRLIRDRVSQCGLKMRTWLVLFYKLHYYRIISFDMHEEGNAVYLNA